MCQILVVCDPRQAEHAIGGHTCETPWGRRFTTVGPRVSKKRETAPPRAYSTGRFFRSSKAVTSERYSSHSAFLLRRNLCGAGRPSDDVHRGSGNLRWSGHPRSLSVTVGRPPTAHRRPGLRGGNEQTADYRTTAL